MKQCFCKYCIENPWPNVWQLDNKLHWVEIPKNCSSAIKKKYKNRNKVDITNRSNNEIHSTIVIYREPIDRFISLFLHYFESSGARYNSCSLPFFAGKGINLENYNLHNRVDICLDYIEEFDSSMEVHHFYPQTYFIDTSIVNSIKYVNIADASSVLGIEKTNSTSSLQRNNLILNNRQIDDIKLMYRNDYKLLDN